MEGMNQINTSRFERFPGIFPIDKCFLFSSVWFVVSS